MENDCRGRIRMEGTSAARWEACPPRGISLARMYFARFEYRPDRFTSAAGRKAAAGELGEIALILARASAANFPRRNPRTENPPGECAENGKENGACRRPCPDREFGGTPARMFPWKHSDGFTRFHKTTLHHREQL